MRGLALVGVLAVATVTGAAAPPPASPPEVAKTVRAFEGSWAVEGSVTASGQEPAASRLRIDCKPTALGAAVLCTMTGETEGMGPFEAGYLVGYDPVEKVVHFMAMTSDGEYHDHKGTWKDDSSLVFDPYPYQSAGGPVTESFGIKWTDSRTMTFTSTTTMADGSSVTFQGKGARRE